MGGLLLSVAAAVALSFLNSGVNPLLIAAVFFVGAIAGACLSGMMVLASPDPARIKPEPPGSSKVTGEVKWFRGSKGFGFIVPDGGGPECFVHRSAIQDGGSLSQGDRVEYNVTEDAKGRVAAESVVKLSKK